MTDDKTRALVERLKPLLHAQGCLTGTLMVPVHRETLGDLLSTIEALLAERKEQAEVILDLQRAACARDGVPMPSERPLVEKLRARIAELEGALERIAGKKTPDDKAMAILEVAAAVAIAKNALAGKEE